MLQSNNIQSFQTFGLEFETENLTPEDCKGLMGYRPTHDSSIENRISVTSRGVKFESKKNDWLKDLLPNTQSKVVGTELVSGIMDSEHPDIFKEINNLCYFLRDAGEVDQCIRSGIHVHISFPSPNVKQLKSILRLGAFFETLFYHLGGMGYNFRGIENDANYCRPITKVGPACIRYKGAWAHCFSLKDLTSIEKFNSDTFWEMYGDLINHRDRYNPVRYTWLNLFPMYPNGQYKGTLEFRVFNHTLNPYFITSMIKMCAYFTQLASRMGYKSIKEEGLLKENSIFDSRALSPNEALDIFKSLVDDDDKDKGVFETAYDILKRVDRFYLPSTPVRSHLYNTRTLNDYWYNSSYKPPVIYDNVKKPKYVDLHVLDGEVRT